MAKRGLSLEEQYLQDLITGEEYEAKLQELASRGEKLPSRASGGLKGLAKKAGPAIGSILGFLALQKILNLPSERGEHNLQREAIQSQKRSVTPEGLYYQAALPQAQSQEEEARQALFAQISGGVLGPQLARGERQIGGR